MVRLSRSLNYFSRITRSNCSNLSCATATITVSNGARRTTSCVNTATDTTGGVALHFYTIDTASLQTAFVGEAGKSYTLRIEAEGKCCMPPPPSLSRACGWTACGGKMQAAS